MPVYYMETGSVDPCRNLALEQFLLEHRTEGDWLMLWQNDNTVVIGRNQNTAEEICADFVRDHGITVVRRMTGGGAVYHDLGNLNYSFLTDAGDGALRNIRQFTEPVCRALEAMGVHAETSGRNDILVEGKKVSGVAQRVHRGRILHHGTLLFRSDPEMIAGALRADPAKFASKSAKSVRSRVGNLADFLPEGTTLAGFWQQLRQELARDAVPAPPLTEEEQEQVRILADTRYRSRDWTYGRDPDWSFRNRRRFPGGTVEVRMDIRGGTIRHIAFFGDFMATEPLEDLTAALEGIAPERQALQEVFSRFDLAARFGSVTAGELTALILDTSGGDGHDT